MKVVKEIPLENLTQDNFTTRMTLELLKAKLKYTKTKEIILKATETSEGPTPDEIFVDYQVDVEEVITNMAETGDTDMSIPAVRAGFIFDKRLLQQHGINNVLKTAIKVSKDRVTLLVLT